MCSYPPFLHTSVHVYNPLGVQYEHNENTCSRLAHSVSFLMILSNMLIYQSAVCVFCNLCNGRVHHRHNNHHHHHHQH